MGNLTVTEIEAEVNRLAKIIQAPADSLPSYRFSRGGAYPHIEVDAWGYYHYVVQERGLELKRKKTWDLDELLFWVFQGITFPMALQYELENRIPGKDFRRMYFSKQEELLGSLHPQWAEKQREIHANILKSHPFHDLA